MPKITIVTFEGSMGEVVNYHRLVSRPYSQGRNPRNLRALNNAHTWTREDGSQENMGQNENLHEIQLESNVEETTNADLSGELMSTDPPTVDSVEQFPELGGNSRTVASLRVNAPLLTASVESANIASQMQHVSLTEGNSMAPSSKSRKRN